MAAVAGIVIPGVCVHAFAFAKAADFAASNSADQWLHCSSNLCNLFRSSLLNIGALLKP